MEENELIAQSQAGKREAFNALVRSYQDRLYNAVLRMANNGDDALDICQEAFIRAFQNIHNFKGQSAFHTWLYQIALNQFYTHYRKKKRSREVSLSRTYFGETGAQKDEESYLTKVSAGQAQHAEAGACPTVLDTLTARERAGAVQAALKDLSQELRQVVVLKDMEGFTYEETARLQKISVGLVRTQLGRAREQLRYALKKYL